MVAGGVLRLRPQRTSPSIITMPMPGISPSLTLSSKSRPAVCCARSIKTKSAARPGSIRPQFKSRMRAVLPVAKQNTNSGGMLPRLESRAIMRKIPRGCTPEPAGPSVPRITRCGHFSCMAACAAAMAIFSLPLCTISMPREDFSHSSQTWASDSDVWPPLM